jgi:hypothetical protein
MNAPAQTRHSADPRDHASPRRRLMI